MTTTIPLEGAQYTSLPPRRLFDIRGAAQYSSCRCSAIEEAIRDGRLRARRLGRGLVITREDLDEFIDRLPVVEPHTPPSVLARKAARLANAANVSEPKPACKDERTGKRQAKGISHE